MHLPEVVFRALDHNGEPKLFVAYLVRSNDGLYAVLSRAEEGRFLPSSPKLDPSRLVEQRDDVSEEPYYLYFGLVDVPPTGFQRLEPPPGRPQE
jgi:hypothetical protein